MAVAGVGASKWRLTSQPTSETMRPLTTASATMRAGLSDHFFVSVSTGGITSPVYSWRTHGENAIVSRMDEGRKRVIGIMAAILASLHMRTAEDLFGGPEGSPRTDKQIAASVQWARMIMEKVDKAVDRA